MKKSMLTATELIEISNRLEMGSYKSIDQFLLADWGIDYDKLPFYKELKSALENMMQRITVDYGSYVSYEWVSK